MNTDFVILDNDDYIHKDEISNKYVTIEEYRAVNKKLDYACEENERMSLAVKIYSQSDNKYTKLQEQYKELQNEIDKQVNERVDTALNNLIKPLEGTINKLSLGSKINNKENEEEIIELRKFYVNNLMETRKMTLEIVEKYYYLFEKHDINCKLIPELEKISDYDFKIINNHPISIKYKEKNYILFKFKSEDKFNYIIISKYKMLPNNIIYVNYWEMNYSINIVLSNKNVFINYTDEYLSIYSVI